MTVVLRGFAALTILLITVSACSKSWDINDSPSIGATERTCGLAREAEYIMNTVLANDGDKTSNIVFRWGDIWKLSSRFAIDAHPDLKEATRIITENLSDRESHSSKEFNKNTIVVLQICKNFDLWSLPTNSYADGVLIFDLDNNWKP